MNLFAYSPDIPNRSAIGFLAIIPAFLLWLYLMKNYGKTGTLIGFVILVVWGLIEFLIIRYLIKKEKM